MILQQKKSTNFVWTDSIISERKKSDPSIFLNFKLNILNLQKDDRSLQAVFFLPSKFSNRSYYDKPWNVSIFCQTSCLWDIIMGTLLVNHLQPFSLQSRH